MTEFTDSDAWTFLAIEGAARGKPSPLAEILGCADAINHAIPTDDELEGGFTRLLQAGLIRMEGRELGLTAEGIALAERCSKVSSDWLEQWQFLAGILKSESFPKACELTYEIQPGESAKAYKTYSGRFANTLKQIEIEEAAEQEDEPDERR